MSEIYTPNRMQIINSVRSNRIRPRRKRITLLRIFMYLCYFAGMLYLTVWALSDK